MLRSARWWAATLAVVVALAGCATVPTSGPVQHHTPDASGVDTGVRVDPLPPADGASQLLVVEGFLHAMGVYQPDYAVARQYLTPAASAAWRPESGVQVYSDLYPPSESDQTVVLNAPLTGTIDPSGRYEPASGQLRHDFGLVKDSADQWRISKPPDGLLVSRYLFTTSFVAANLHFTDSGGSVLAPDPRFFASGEQALAAAVRAQLAGPSAWLQPAVRRLDTTAITVGALALDSFGVLDVPLGRAAEALTLEQRRMVLAELAYTMTGFSQVNAVRVVGAGQVWRTDTGDTEVNRDAFGDLSAANVNAPRALYLFRDGELQRSRNPSTWSDFDTVDVALSKVDGFAVRGDLQEVAAVTSGGSRLEVAVLGGGKSRVRRSGGDLLRPDYARNGELWSATTAGPRTLKVYRGDASVAVDASGLPDRPLVAARLSPDGTRLALVLRRGEGTEVGLALVERRGESQDIVVSGWRRLDVTVAAGVPAGTAVDLGWVSEVELAVLQTGMAGDTSVVRVRQDGAAAADIGPSDAPALTQLAVVPGRPAGVLAAGGAAYRFDNEFNWSLSITGVDALAYSG